MYWELKNEHRCARLSLPLAVEPLQADSFGKKLLRFDFYAVHRILIQQAPPLQLLQQPRVEVACNLFRGAQAVIEIYFYKGGVGEDFRYDKINEKKQSSLTAFVCFVGAEGFEPPTLCL